MPPRIHASSLTRWSSLGYKNCSIEAHVWGPRLTFHPWLRCTLVALLQHLKTFFRTVFVVACVGLNNQGTWRAVAQTLVLLELVFLKPNHVAMDNQPNKKMLPVNANMFTRALLTTVAILTMWFLYNRLYKMQRDIHNSNDILKNCEKSFDCV